jgi:N-acetylneuraminate lyase
MVMAKRSIFMNFHITGLVPAVFTPMRANGDVNLELIPTLTDQLIAEGASALYVCGSTGEGPSLMREERKAVAEAYVQAAAGRIPVMIQVGHNSIRESQLLAAHAQEIGADVISAVPPSYFKAASLDNLMDILADILDAAPELPFYYYHIPRLSSADIDVVKMLEMSADRLPTLVGVKYSDFTVFEMQECLSVDNGRYNMLFGSDEMLLSGLVAGAHGAVGSTYNFAMPLYKRVVAAFERGDIAEAQREQALAVRMVRRTLPFGNPALKCIMKFIGLDCGPARLPQIVLTPAKEDALRHSMEEIGFFDWGHPVIDSELQG